MKRNAALLLSLFFCFVIERSSAQTAPVISYDNPPTFIVGNSIPVVKPYNMGGPVPNTIPGTVSTFAGSGIDNEADGQGASASFSNPVRLTSDIAGNIYVTDNYGNVIRKIDALANVSTIAGTGTQGSADGPSLSATFNGPSGICRDINGNIYISDTDNNRIRKISANGDVTTLAGSDTQGATDGQGIAASFGFPQGLAVDAAGYVYVADYTNNKIRKISPSGEVTTFAGSGNVGSADGTGTAASFNSPLGIAVDAAGNVYVADSYNYKIRKITPQGVVSTLAGSGSFGSTDGVGRNASFKQPTEIAVDAAGNVYVADTYNHKIRKITPAGVVSSLAGNGKQGRIDAVGALASFNQPSGICVDQFGNVYIADAGNNKIRKISQTGYTISPSLPAGLSFDATTGIISGTPQATSQATSYTITATNEWGTSTTTIIIVVKTPPVATTGKASNITYDGAVVNGLVNANGTETKVSFEYGLTTSYGTSVSSTQSTVNGWSSTAVSANLSHLLPNSTYHYRVKAENPLGTALGADFTFTTLEQDPIIKYESPLSFAATFQIATIFPQNSGGAVPVMIPGKVVTLAGNGTSGAVDNIGTSASFNRPMGVAADKSGNIYVADSKNNKIRKIAPDGTVTSFAGSGVADSLDGTGTAAGFDQPTGIALDGSDNVYVTDFKSNLIRKITPTGVVTTIAGNGNAGYADGQGTNSSFSGPYGIAVSASGYIYVSDNGNNRIRKISPSGYVSNLAGNGTSGSADGNGSGASFNNPCGIAVDVYDNVYVADTWNNKIRKISPSGLVTTLAGTGDAGTLDGNGKEATFNNPTGLAVDAVGFVYTTDYSGNKLRKISKYGDVSSIAGGTYGATDGVGAAASFKFPNGVALDQMGYIYVADFNNHKIRKVSQYGYSISPALPDDLSFDPSNGTINGTPKTVTGKTTYQVIASNIGGTDTTSIVIEIIAPSAPLVTTGKVSSVKSSTASLNGTINTHGVLTSISFEYGLTSNYGSSTSASTPQINSAVDMSFSTNIAGLKPYTTYHYRAKAENSFGILYGADKTFTTKMEAPNISYVSPKTYKYSDAIIPFVPTNTGGSVPAMIPGLVTTFTGGGSAGASDDNTTGDRLSSPKGMCIDNAGNKYVADAANNKIRKVSASGVVSTYAGSGSAGSNDGSALKASFNNPSDVVADQYGNLYVADASNHKIRKIAANGDVTTYAGSGTVGAGDNSSTNASFSNPTSLCIDKAGNIYVADMGNNKIRKISPQQVVSTFAGTGSAGATNGAALVASFNAPSGIAIDDEDNVYIADTQNNSIRKISSDGTVTTLAGSSRGHADGRGTNASFNQPQGINLDIMGNVYVADSKNNLIRKVSPDGDVSTIAGNLDYGLTDGIRATATFGYPNDIAVDFNGTLYVVDKGNDKVRKITQFGYSIDQEPSFGMAFNPTTAEFRGNDYQNISPRTFTVTAYNMGGVDTAQITIITKYPDPTGDTPPGSYDPETHFISYFPVSNITAHDATLGGIVFDNRTVTIASYDIGTSTSTTESTIIGTRIGGTDMYLQLHNLSPKTLYYYRIKAENSIATFYGEWKTFKTDSAPPDIRYTSPHIYRVGVAIENLVPTNLGGDVPSVATGMVSTFAGSGIPGAYNGAGILASFNTPLGIAIDKQGNIFVSEEANNKIRMITPKGQVSTFAGNGTNGNSNGFGQLASFNAPGHIAFNTFGELMVADVLNNQIRKISQSGYVNSYMGTGERGAVDGDPYIASFYQPMGIDVTNGNVIVADRANNKIRSIYGNGWGVSTVAGNGLTASVDGNGRNVSFIRPSDVVVDRSGNYFVTENQTNKIRKIAPDGTVTTFAGSGETGAADGIGTAASFNYPLGLTIDATDNLFVADTKNNKIRKITPDGMVTTLAGSGLQGSDDGVGGAASFNWPLDAAIDASGNIFVTDYLGNKIRKISQYGYSISPKLPNGLNFDYTTGIISGTPTTLTEPTNYTVTASNNKGESKAVINIGISGAPVIVSDSAIDIRFSSCNLIGSIKASGALTSASFEYGTTTSYTSTVAIAGETLNGWTAQKVNAPLTNLKSNTVYHYRLLAVNNSGQVASEDKTFATPTAAPDISYETPQVYYVGAAISDLLPVNKGGAVEGSSEVVVSTLFDFSDVGNVHYSDIRLTDALALDRFGNFYTTNTNSTKILKISPSGEVSTLAGSDVAGHKNGIGESASFQYIHQISSLPTGDLLVCESGYRKIRKISSTGVTSDYADRNLNWQNGRIYADNLGVVYYVHPSLGLAKVTLNGDTIPLEIHGDVSSVYMKFNIYNIIVDKHSNVYFFTEADRDGFLNNLYKRDTTGNTKLFVYRRNEGVFDNSCDDQGNIYFFGHPDGFHFISNDRLGCQIFKVTPSGDISVFAGSGIEDDKDGNAKDASFTLSWPLLGDGENLYVGGFGKIRKISLGNGGYRITPQLPAGLVFDSKTGKISGTPVIASAAENFTVTASNGSGSSSAIINITVKEPSAPLAFTTVGSAVTSSDAVLNGIVSANGMRTTVSFEYGTSTSYTASVSIPGTLTSNIAGSTVASLITGLQPNTKYHFRIKAVNAKGESWGEDKTFVTNMLKPIIDYTNPINLLVDQTMQTISPENTGGEVPPTIPGAVSSFAGSGNADSENGFGVSASFKSPYGLTIDKAGNLYVSDCTDNKIRKIASDGTVTTFAGSGSMGAVDGNSMSSSFNYPQGLAVDDDGNLYVADTYNNEIRKIAKDGTVSTLAGNTTAGSNDNIGALARFNHPSGIVADIWGNIYVSDTENHKIRKISATGVVTTFAGTGAQGDADGAASQASFAFPAGLAMDANGNLYVADSYNNKIRMITPDGQVSTLAGSGSAGSKDSTGINASFNQPKGISVDQGGNVWVADSYNQSIRKISTTGLVSTIAGNGSLGTTDGISFASSFNSPSGIVVDGTGNLYVSDLFGRKIRKIVSTGYTIQPNLPAGLSFDATNGQITGTPTNQQNPKDYTISATNAGGTDTKTISIAIISPNAPTATATPASEITPFSAKMNGVVNANGATTSVSFEYGTSTNYTATVSLTENVLQGSSGEKVNIERKGLIPNTTYFYRIRVENSFGVSYSGNQSFTTARQELNITGIAAQDKTYDGTTSVVVTGTASLSGILAGASGVGLNSGSNSFSDKNAGNNKQVISSYTISGPDVDRYVLIQPNLHANIIPAPLNIQANNRSKVYGETPSFTGTEFTIQGLIGGESVESVSFVSDGILAGADVSNSPYPIHPMYANGSQFIPENYAINYMDGSLSLTKKSVSIQIDAVEKMYDGNTTATFANGVILGLVGSDDVQIVAGQGTFDNKNAGKNKIVSTTDFGITGTKANNYLLKQQPVVLSSILPKQINVYAGQNQSKVYHQPDPVFTFTNSPNLLQGDTFTGALTRETGEAVSAYPILKGDLSAGDNYSISFASENFSVNPLPITITPDPNQLKVYGEADPSFTYQFAPNLEDNDQFTGAIARNGGETVGAYRFGLGNLSAGANYKLSISTENFKIKAKPILMEVNPNQRKVYGEADPSFSFSLHPNLLAGDSYTGQLSRAKGEGTGSYAINQGDFSLSENYSITFISSDFEITPKPITVTVKSNQTKIYGDSDPVFVYAFTPSLLGNDVFNGSLMRQTGESTGKYSVEQGSLTAGSNYTISFIHADFTIKAKEIQLDLSKVNFNKTYDGTTLSALHGKPSLIGILPSDEKLVDLQFPNSISFLDKNVGDAKAIQVSDFTLIGSAASNYILQQQRNLKANISKANLSLSISAADKYYDGQVNAQVSITDKAGFVAGDELSVTPIHAAFESKDAGKLKLLTSAFEVSGKDAGNYEIGQLASARASILPIELPALIHASPDLTYVKGGVPIQITVTYDRSSNLIDKNPIFTIKGGGIDAQMEMVKKNETDWTYLWTPPSTGDGLVSFSVVVPDAAGNFVQSFSGKTSIVLDNTPPSVNLKDNYAIKLVKNGNKVSFIAAFSDLNGIDENIVPVLGIDGIALREKMTKSSNLVWTYEWDVPANVDKRVNVSIEAFDVAGNKLSNGVDISSFLIDNTPPSIHFSLQPVDQFISVKSPALIKIGDPFKMISSLKDAIVLRENNSQGKDVAFELISVNESAPSPQIAIKSAFVCGAKYYLAVKNGSLTDIVGNPNIMSDTILDFNIPVKPMIANQSSAKDKSKYCSNDNVLCTNFGALPLSYQWSVGNHSLEGETKENLVVNQDRAGQVSILVKNLQSGCMNTSDSLPVAIYPINKPRVEVEKESDIVCLLRVDNRANIYTNYEWQNGDGSSINPEIVTNRQFIVLPYTYSSGSYRVIVTDIYGCKTTSDNSTFKFAEIKLLLYPTLNDGHFKVDISMNHRGKVMMNAYNQWGVRLKEFNFQKTMDKETFEIDLPNLPSGAYTLEIITEGFKETLKFFIL